MRINYEALRAAPYVSPFYERRSLVHRALRHASRLLMRCCGAHVADAILTERMAEVPEFIARVRGADPASPILDVGCAESFMPLHYLAMGYEVHGVDLRDPELDARGFSFIHGDAGKLEFQRQYDVITLLSTLEHAGFAHYDGGAVCDDHAVIGNLRRFLTPTGRFICSVPCGKPQDFEWFRVYDLARLVEVFGVVEAPRWFLFETPTWYPCSQEDAERVQTAQWAEAVIVFESPGLLPGEGLSSPP